MTVVDMDTATERELRKLKQRIQELEHTLASVAYLHENLTPFDPATHPWCVSARATREALLQGGRLTPPHHGAST